MVLDAMINSHTECEGYVDDKFMTTWFGFSVFQWKQLVGNKEIRLHLAIGNNNIRKMISANLGKVNYYSVRHPASVLSTSANIGDGTFLAAQSVVAPDVKIGIHCIVNHSAVVDHDCIIGDFSHIAPQASLGGGASVGNGVLVGSGAVILPGVKVGDYAVIGAGAIVTKNVSASTTVVGNPARIIE